MATNTDNKKRLYLTNWNYNAALILDELETVVLNYGGAIVSTWEKEAEKQYLIQNRSLLEKIQEQERHAEIMKANNRPGAAAAQEELERLKAIPNEPRESRNGNFYYISFVLDGFYYCYNMDDNPFFDFTFSKIPVVNGCIDPDTYSRTDKKEWLYDCFFRFDCPNADRREAAHLILNMLQAAHPGERYRGSRRPQRLHVLKGEL